MNTSNTPPHCDGDTSQVPSASNDYAGSAATGEREVKAPVPPRAFKSASGWTEAHKIACEYIASLQARLKGERKHIPSGLRDLDHHLGGWLHASHFIVVAARPGLGKTALVQQVSEHVAQQVRTVLFCPLEMSAHELGERSVSRRSGVPLPVLKTADKLPPAQLAEIERAAEEFALLPFIVNDATYDITALTSSIAAKAAELKARGGAPLGLVVIDHLQLTQGKGENRNVQLTVASGALKRLAKDLDAAVIALSQLNRDTERRQDNRPRLADLRECSAIEQDADLVLGLYRDEEYNLDSKDKGILEIITLKNRHGPRPTIRLAFNAQRGQFGDLAHSHQIEGAVRKQVKPTTARGTSAKPEPEPCEDGKLDAGGGHV